MDWTPFFGATIYDAPPTVAPGLRGPAPGAGYTVYSICLFLTAAWLLAGETDWVHISNLPASAFVIGALSYAFAVFIILAGFSTPTGSHISLDRITQVGLTLMFGPVFSAIVNGMASFTYPLIRRQSSPAMACVKALHNSGMFALIVYLSGKLYASLGGPFPPSNINVRVAAAFFVLVLAMQGLNGLFILLRDFATRQPIRWNVDWFSHRIEAPVALVGLISASLYGQVSTFVFSLYLLLIVSVILIVKFLNTLMVTLKLQVVKNVALIHDLEDRKASLEQKVSERVAEIQQQRIALESANAKQAKLLDSLRTTSEKLEQQTREDALTGLHNRRFLDEFLAREHARAVRHETALSVAMMDVDHFKAVNDTFSHLTGDAVLKALGRILPEHTRGLDMVARYGGEEIFFCFPDTEIDQAAQVCERARKAVESYDWQTIAPGLQITVSFGVAQSSHESIEQLMYRCDQNLYKAKNGGRNQVCG